MKNVIVCGDSHMSPRTHVLGTHFSEIFSKYFDYNLISYARSAMSNGGIFLQLEHAIKQNPALVLIGTTHTDRFEFKVSEDFTQEISLTDLYYGDGVSNDISCVDFAKNNGSLASQAFRQYLDDQSHDILNYHNLHFLNDKDDIDRKLKAIKFYFHELYHPSWKAKMDEHLLYSIVHKLHSQNIPYVICHDPCQFFTTEKCQWLNNKNIIANVLQVLNYPDDIKNNENGIDPGYHTSKMTQEKMADALIQHYKKYFL